MLDESHYFLSVVVPHAGTWIEINQKGETKMVKMVVPHAGTWIEILDIDEIE